MEPSSTKNSQSQHLFVDAEENINKYKLILKSTWSKLLKNKEEVGLSIYKSIVFGSTSRRNGTAKATSEIFENTNLKQQSGRFMDMLNAVISKLDQVDVLIETLQRLSLSHSKAYNVKKPNYYDFKNGFMKAIKREYELQEVWTTKYEDSWQWFWNFIISIMSPQLIIHNHNHHNDDDDDDDNYMDYIDINDYFLALFDLLSKSLNTKHIPHEIIEVITLFCLNLTQFHRDRNNKLMDISSHGDTVQLNNSQLCSTIMSPYWISNKHRDRSPLSKYIHRIEVIVENNRNINGLIDSFEVCIGFTSAIVNHNIQGSNGFADLECGFGVRAWDLRLIRNGIISSKYTLCDKQQIQTNTHKLEILKRRLHERMKINDTLTFLVDIKEDNTTLIDIELNGVKQTNDELKFVLNKIDNIALCISLWTIGIAVRISCWTLIQRKDS